MDQRNAEKIDLCLQSSLQQQEDLIAVLLNPSVDDLQFADEALTHVLTETISCAQPAVYEGYAEAPENRFAARSRKSLASSKVLRWLNNRRFYADASLARDDAMKSQIPTLRVEAMLEYAESRLNRREAAQALEVGSAALQLGREVNYPWGEAQALAFISRCHDYLGQYGEALEAKLESIDILNTLFDEVHPTMSLAYYELGELYLGNNQPEAAANSYFVAMDIAAGAFGAKSAAVAHAQDYLCAATELAHRPEDAQHQCLSALSTMSEVLGNRHPHLGGIYGHLSFLQSTAKNHAHARSYLRQAIKIYEDSLGREHPYVAGPRYNLASSYWRTGEFSLAIPELEGALAAALSDPQVSPYFLYSAHETLGNCYYQLKSYERALESFREAVGYAAHAATDVGHERLVRIYVAMGLSYAALGSRPSALVWIDEAIAIHSAKYGERSKEVAALLGRIGDKYGALSDYDAAIAMYKRALLLYVEMFAPDAPEMQLLYGAMGDVYGRLEEYDLALKYHEDSLKLLLASSDQQMDVIARTYRWIAWEQSALGDEACSCASLRLARDAYEKALGADHPETRETADLVNECAAHPKEECRSESDAR